MSICTDNFQTREDVLTPETHNSAPREKKNGRRAEKIKRKNEEQGIATLFTPNGPSTLD